MASILKGILGSIFRNWLSGISTALVAAFLAHHWVTQDQAGQITVWFSNHFDAWSTIIAATVIGGLPGVALSVWSNLRARLKKLIALALPADRTEQDVNNLLAATPASARIAAVLTQDPTKINP